MSASKREHKRLTRKHLDYAQALGLSTIMTLAWPLDGVSYWLCVLALVISSVAGRAIGRREVDV